MLDENLKQLQKSVAEFIKCFPPPLGEWFTLQMNICRHNDNEIVMTMPMLFPLQSIDHDSSVDATIAENYHPEQPL